jgi:hypothetical protein
MMFLVQYTLIIAALFFWEKEKEVVESKVKDLRLSYNIVINTLKYKVNFTKHFQKSMFDSTTFFRLN